MGMRLAAFLLAPWALLAQGPPAAASPCDKTPAYSPCEMVFELSGPDAAAHPNPYVSVQLKIEFRSPRLHTFAMPAFWDGGGRLVVRFSPTEAGKWDYRVTSNIASWNDREGSFTAAASDSPGFIQPAEVRHWAYTERNLAHLWMGATELGFASLGDADFRAVADARAAQKFNHLRGLATAEGPGGAYQSADSPNLDWFRQLDQRVRYLNQKGLAADLILASRPAAIAILFASHDQRVRFARYMAARYAAFNVTWQGVQEFESDPDARALLRELGDALREADPYQHPRTSGARVTSGPLLDDHWMDFIAYGPGADGSVGAVEHQLYAVPFVNLEFAREDSGAGKSGPSDLDPDAFRHRLWNATMDGQYPTYANTGAGSQYLNSPGARAMTAWFNFFSGARHWELEPYFDVEGGRAVALEDTDYIVYVEKPGPLDLTVEKHSYDVIWMNPADGQVVKQKKQFNGDHFTGEPPDRSHDWVLRLARLSRLESMARSYHFESRIGEEGSPALPIVVQEIESSPEKVPFAIEEPAGDLSVSKPAAYSAKVTRQTRATRSILWLWTGEVTEEGQGYRVLATAQKGDLQPPPGMATTLPATMLLRLYGMNANGKVYLLNKACRLTP
jgi:hypothetical protein